MGTVATEDYDADLTAALRGRGQRVTPQRLAIHRTLRELDRHVSAEDLLEAVDRTVPGVSLPTVYSTLELLEQLDLARRIGPVGGRVLFDPRVDDHGHVVCSRCGRVEDLDARVDSRQAVAAAGRAGYSHPVAGLIVTGVCSRCHAGS